VGDERFELPTPAV